MSLHHYYSVLCAQAPAKSYTDYSSPQLLKLIEPGTMAIASERFKATHRGFFTAPLYCPAAGEFLLWQWTNQDKPITLDMFIYDGGTPFALKRKIGAPNYIGA